MLRIFALCSLLLACAAGCNAPAQQGDPPKPPTVTVAYPEERKVTEYLEFTGTTRSYETVEVRARVTGYLHKINFTDGQEVNKDDLLFVIEQKPFAVARDTANANVLKAKARLKLAEADLKRTEPLVMRGALPQQELDVRVADVASANADVAAAESAVDQAQLNYDYTEVHAPTSGRISHHMVDEGNLVSAGTTILARIERQAPIYAYFAVSENDLLRVRKVAEMEKDLKEKSFETIYLATADEMDFPHDGKLSYEELGIDPESGTQMRRAVFANKDRKLLPGLFVRVRVPLGQSQKRLMIDERAIGADQVGNFVLVVNSVNEVEKRDVTLGVRDRKQVLKEVREQRAIEGIDVPITAQDRIVVNGLQKAHLTQPVTPHFEGEKPKDEKTADTGSSKPGKGS